MELIVTAVIFAVVVVIGLALITLELRAKENTPLEVPDTNQIFFETNIL